ncbi:MAG: lipocalin family protein [Chitinophagaceae bacterium]|nr:lipocalin family protein [Chitinophagaceae bacterium]MCW5926399.1 lipocalin family protein [Chitinophagaceae bacterium]
MKRIIFLSLFLVTMSLLSCKKETTQTTDPFKLLTKDVWIMTANTYQKDLDPSPTDAFSGMQDCLKDDEYQFLSDRKYYRTDGPTSCGNLPGISGSWQLSADEKKILLTIGSATKEYEIVELTQNKLVTRMLDYRNTWVSTYTH